MPEGETSQVAFGQGELGHGSLPGAAIEGRDGKPDKGEDGPTWCCRR